MKRRIFSFLIAAFLCVQSISLSAFANSLLTTTLPKEQERFESADANNEALNLYVEDVDAFCSRILEGIAQCSPQIILSDLNIPKSREATEAVAWYIWKEMPEAFHVYEISFSSYMSSSVLYSINLTYYYTASEYSKMLSECVNSASKLLCGIQDNDALSDAEKALVLHDRLALLCEYDFTATENRYDMYGALVCGIAVCEGYTKAYSYLLDCIGIQNYFCGSSLLGHAWNIVSIDGETYHVDVTWDDKTPDRIGRVHHENFLRSSKGMIATGHIKNGSVDYDQTPTSSLYDSSYWQNSHSAFEVVGDSLVYIDHTAFELRQVQNDIHTVLCSVENVWKASSNSSWSGNYSCLAVACQSVLFSQPNGIYAYHLKSGETELVYEPVLSESSYESIYGFRFVDGNLQCSISTSPNYGSSDSYSTIVQKAYHVPEKDHLYSDDTDPLCNSCGAERELVMKPSESPVIGDLNGDGIVSSGDAIYLLYYTVFPSRYPVTGNCDYNGDFAVDSVDAIYLLYHTVFPSRYPLS